MVCFYLNLFIAPENELIAIIILGTTQYKLHDGRLLAYSEAEAIYNNLCAPRLPDEKHRLIYYQRRQIKIKSSLWTTGEICLLQWAVLNYCDQKDTTPPQFVHSYSMILWNRRRKIGRTWR